MSAPESQHFGLARLLASAEKCLASCFLKKEKKKREGTRRRKHLREDFSSGGSPFPVHYHFFNPDPREIEAFRGSGTIYNHKNLINLVRDGDEARPRLKSGTKRHMWKEFSVSQVTRVFGVSGESNQGVRMLLTYPASERPSQVQLRERERGSTPGRGPAKVTLRMDGKSASIAVIPRWSA